MRWLNGIIDSMDMNLSTVQEILRDGDGTPLQYSCLENPMDGGTAAPSGSELWLCRDLAWNWAPRRRQDGQDSAWPP